MSTFEQDVNKLKLDLAFDQIYCAITTLHLTDKHQNEIYEIIKTIIEIYLQKKDLICLKCKNKRSYHDAHQTFIK